MSDYRPNWYHVKEVSNSNGKQFEVIKVNVKKNPFKHYVGDVINLGGMNLRNYFSDGQAYLILDNNK